MYAYKKTNTLSNIKYPGNYTFVIIAVKLLTFLILFFILTGSVRLRLIFD